MSKVALQVGVGAAMANVLAILAGPTVLHAIGLHGNIQMVVDHKKVYPAITTAMAFVMAIAGVYMAQFVSKYHLNMHFIVLAGVGLGLVHLSRQDQSVDRSHATADTVPA